MTEHSRPEARRVTRRETLRKGAILSGGLVASGTAISGRARAASGKFRLHGTAEVVNEPDVRPTNHVVEIDTSETGLAGNASRPLGATADELAGRLSFDFYVVEGDSGGGSPRISLAVDNTGDGSRDGFVHGHADPQSTGTPAAQQSWHSVDLTDGVARWETAQLDLGLGFVVPYSDVVAHLDENHTILSGMLVDDSYWKASAAGVTYYDGVAVGDRTLDGHRDVVGRR